MKILKTSLKMLKKHALCDSCLGRQFATLGYGMNNEERGKYIKALLLLKASALIFMKKKSGLKTMKILAFNGFSEKAHASLLKTNPQIKQMNHYKKCYLCQNEFDEIDEIVEKAVKKLEDYEFSSFLVGIELPFAFEEREDEFKASFKVKFGENLRNEFSKVIGEKIVEKTGKGVNHVHPEIVILANLVEKKVNLQINPISIAGKYKKFLRGLPQSKWFCFNCHGKGCKDCNWTGQLYSESIEELLAPFFINAAKGLKTTFHTCGREDIDARMLGRGRPFVMEVINPEKRFFNLKQLENLVNKKVGDKVEVSNLKFVSKNYVRKLKKAESARKEYLLLINLESALQTADLSFLEKQLSNAIIKQKTPIRVLHRRSDLTREKYIYWVKVKKLSPNKIEITLQCQGGLYVKELVTGDEGRTTPNVSGILGIKARPISLDVLNVIFED